MKKLVVLCLAVGMLTTLANAQEKPIRIGLKFGIPNIIGLNGEYVTPALGERLAPTLDFSYFSVSAGEAKASFSYLELGANCYFKSGGKGPYGHLSYGRIGFSGKYTDPVLGSGKGSLGINLLNIKLGAKWGNGFYFRPELGYALLLGNNKVKVKYDDPTTGQTVTQEKSVPGFLGGGVVFNLGFGVAF